MLTTINKRILDFLYGVPTDRCYARPGGEPPVSLRPGGKFSGIC